MQRLRATLLFPLRLHGLSMAPPSVLLCRLLMLSLLPAFEGSWVLAAAAFSILWTPYLRTAALIEAVTLLWQHTDSSHIVLGLLLAAGTLNRSPWSWPRRPAIVIWDGACGLCAASKRLIQAIDPDAAFEFIPWQTGIGARWGLAEDLLRQRMYVADAEELLHSYAAWRFIVGHLAAFWILPVLGFTLFPSPIMRLATAFGVLFLWSPLSNPLGNAAYRWVARRRHKLWPGGACEIENPVHKAVDRV